METKSLFYSMSNGIENESLDVVINSRTLRHMAIYGIWMNASSAKHETYMIEHELNVSSKCHYYIRKQFKWDFTTSNTLNASFSSYETKSHATCIWVICKFLYNIMHLSDDRQRSADATMEARSMQNGSTWQYQGTGAFDRRSDTNLLDTEPSFAEIQIADHNAGQRLSM